MKRAGLAGIAFDDNARRSRAVTDWANRFAPVGPTDVRAFNWALIDLGALGGDKAIPGDARAPWRRPCVLVSFSLNGNKNLPYVGFLVADSPRLVRIRPGDLLSRETSERHPLVLYAVELQGRSAWIPDLDEVERQVLPLVSHG